MKKLAILLALVLMSTVMLSACGDSPADGQDETERPQDVPEYAKLIGDDEITDLLESFILTQDFLFTEPPASGGETADYNGREYYNITDENYDTWDEWSALFYSVYTDEFAENLLNLGTVINIDGAAYSDGGSRGNDVDNNYEYSVVETQSGSITVEMYRPYHPEGDEDATKVDVIVIVKTDYGWRIESNNGWNGSVE